MDSGALPFSYNTLIYEYVGHGLSNTDDPATGVAKKTGTSTHHPQPLETRALCGPIALAQITHVLAETASLGDYPTAESFSRRVDLDGRLFGVESERTFGR